MGNKLPEVDLGTNFIITQIVSGGYHTCAVSSLNTVKCWGRNDYGTLGYGDTNDRGDSVNEMGDNLLLVDIGQGFVTNRPTPAPSMAPTTSPTHSPTLAPSSSPTSPPSLAPSLPPTSSPTHSPSSAPTTCYENGNQTSHDGYDENIHDKIKRLDFTNDIIDLDNMMYIMNEVEFYGKPLMFQNQLEEQVICTGTVACHGSSLSFSNMSVCNVLCDGPYSCARRSIYIDECQNCEIICNGTHSCDDMKVAMDSSSSGILNVYCGLGTSCNNLEINVFGNSITSTACIGLNACDGLTINVDPDDYKNNKLQMFSYSDNVTLSNGFGYEELNDSAQYVECHETSTYIEWNESLNADEQVTPLILDEYEGGRFPCESVTIGCFQANNSQYVSYCNMKFTVKADTFTIKSHDDLAKCYWVEVGDIIDISCEGDCVTSPTEDPTSSPSASPTEPTINPTINPTTDPTIDPTKDPTTDPTTAPSISPSAPPTRSPSFSPSFSPTLNPTVSPSSNPTISPTEAPSIAPTLNPTIAPSVPPTRSPSFSPSFSPTLNPTVSPSNAPSTPPSSAPSRVPTQDVDLIYDTKIEIEYEVKGLAAKDKHFIVDNARLAVGTFKQFVEMGYFSEANDLKYTDFWCDIYEINDVNVETLDDDTPLSIYDLDILDQYPEQGMILNTRIECDGDNGEIVIKRSGTSIFTDSVQELLVEFFNNSHIEFSVATSDDALQEELKFPPNKPEDTTAVYLSVVIVSLGAIVSFAAFVFKKSGKSKMDSAKFLAPLLVSLAIYDFVSDVNFAIQIFKNDEIEFTVNNIFVWLGVLSLIFIVSPFVTNIIYAKNITSQRAITQSPSARSWFSQNLGQFILICILCSGTYPVLILCNSQIFDLDFFELGLLRSDLQELSKIKIRSTIFMENCPQLVIQVVYAINRNKLENATILAFFASLLSVVASLIIYQAQRDQAEGTVNAKYFIRFGKKNPIDDQQKKRIARNKGYKQRLAKHMCEAFGISQKSIEVGFVTPNTNGCVVRLQHSIFKDDLDSTDSLGSYRMKPEMYARNLYVVNESKITKVFKNHFEITDREFTVSYHEKEQKRNVNRNDGWSGDDQGRNKPSVVALETTDDDEGNENKTDGIFDRMTSNLRQKTLYHLQTSHAHDKDDYVYGKVAAEVEMEPMKDTNTDLILSQATKKHSYADGDDDIVTTDGDILKSMQSTQTQMLLAIQEIQHENAGQSTQMILAIQEMQRKIDKLDQCEPQNANNDDDNKPSHV
eukprot:1013867_1